MLTPTSHVAVRRGSVGRLVVSAMLACGAAASLVARAPVNCGGRLTPDEVFAADGTARLSERRPHARAVQTDTRGIQWARIPAGTFEMGCTAGDSECGNDEIPPHRVTISHAFEMMTTEVTLAMYRRYGPAPSQPSWNTDDQQPVMNVTWAESSAFCAAIGGRLPTEAEWEYAARGGHNDWRYPWGNEASRAQANYGADTCCSGLAAGADRWVETAPVGSFPANGYGLLDMAGNAWEWVADWYEVSYYERSPSTDPTGPSTGTSRVFRGGSWFSDPWGLRVSYRDMFVPADRGGMCGFRCARDVSPGSAGESANGPAANGDSGTAAGRSRSAALTHSSVSCRLAMLRRSTQR